MAELSTPIGGCHTVVFGAHNLSAMGHPGKTGLAFPDNRKGGK